MKWSLLFLSVLALNTCDSSESSIRFRLKANRNTFVAGDTLQLEIRGSKNKPIDSVRYFMDNTPLTLPYSFGNERLGDHQLQAKIYSNGNQFEATETVRLLQSEPPELWTYTLLNSFPHDATAYTQGLEFDGDVLYESTGLNGKSSLRKVNYKTGKVLQQIPLDTQYFGEGITLLDGKIYQLTWQENTAFVYDQDSFELLQNFTYDQSKEGWGLCTDGNYLYKSDGSAKIWRLDPKTGAEIDYIEATTHKTILTKINELEWVDGKIYANTYQFQKEVVVVIDPNTGAIEKVIDFSGLKEKVDQIPSLNVLNGIAFHPTRKTFFVTGKNWSKLFEVTLQPKP